MYHKSSSKKKNKKNKENKQIQKDGYKKMRQFNLMLNKLHQMLRTLGEQQIGSNNIIKLDQFQKLRRLFSTSAQQYESSNNELKNTSDRLIRAQLTFKIIQNKKIMKQILQQCTKLCIKLKRKVQKQRINKNNYVTPSKKSKKKKMFDSDNDDQVLIVDRDQLFDTNNKLNDKKQVLTKQLPSKSIQQQQLQYKSLTLFSMQKIYFKLVQSQQSSVTKIKKQIQSKKFTNIQQLKAHASQKKLIQQIQQSEYNQEDNLQQKQILQAIRILDDDIEIKMIGILQGVNKLHDHAKNISQGLDLYHERILVNISVVDQNLQNVHKGQKMLEQVVPYGKKPKCICNVILLIILALVVYLFVVIFINKETGGDDVIVGQVKKNYLIVNNS